MHFKKKQYFWPVATPSAVVAPAEGHGGFKERRERGAVEQFVELRAAQANVVVSLARPPCHLHRKKIKRQFIAATALYKQAGPHFFLCPYLDLDVELRADLREL